jgi:hypothetical protein
MEIAEDSARLDLAQTYLKKEQDKIQAALTSMQITRQAEKRYTIVRPAGK